MKKRILNIAIFLLLFLLLLSCKRVPQGEEPLSTEAALKLVQTGTEGVKLSAVSNYPPARIYDQNPLVMLIDVKNKGNFNLETQDCFVQVTGYDPNIITGMPEVKSCAENTPGVLEGKNVYNVQGGMNQLEFSSSPVILSENVGFEYSPVLNVLSCYRYHTSAHPAVCVDPLIYQISSEQKACTPNDIGMGGGQGGPVGVTYVGVEMVGKRAIFEINLKNLGSGRVLSSDADLRNCASVGLDYRDLDKVNYQISLSSGSLVDCKPQDGVVRLANGQGKVVCSFEIPGGTAYETPLAIDLDYAYVDSFTKPIKIIKTPQ